MKLPFQLCLCLSLITFAVTQYWHSGRRWIDRFFPVKDRNCINYFNILQQNLEELQLQIDRMKKDRKAERDDQKTKLDHLKIESGQCKAGIAGLEQTIEGLTSVPADIAAIEQTIEGLTSVPADIAAIEQTIEGLTSVPAGIAGLEQTIEGLTSVPADPCRSMTCGDNAFCITVLTTAKCQCLDGFVVRKGQSIQSNGCVLELVVTCDAVRGNICTETEKTSCIFRGNIGVDSCGTSALFKESTTLSGAVEDMAIQIDSQNEELLKCYFGDDLPSGAAFYFSVTDASCKSVEINQDGTNKNFILRTDTCNSFASARILFALCTFP